MRTSIPATTLFLGFWLVVIGAQHPAQGLQFGVRAADYFGVMYAAPPSESARYLFFSTEPLGLMLEVGNRGDVLHELQLVGVGIDGAFHMTAQRIPTGANMPRLLVSTDLNVTDGGIKSQRTFGDPLEVPSLGIVTWPARLVPQGRWSPGVYELLITPQFSGVSERVNLNTPLLRFELRETGDLADRAEIARRRMMRAYVSDDPVVMGQEADRLLAVYPQSSVAYEIKAEVAKRNGRRDEAAASLQQALALITAGQDVLYLRQRTDADVQQLVSGLNRSLGQLR
jgi:hypothetical protein